MTLGYRIKSLREKRGLTQSELAELCGWTGSSRISNYEKDTREPNINDIKIIAGIFNVDPGWLQFSAEDSPFSNVGKPIIPNGKVPVVSWVQAGAFCGNTQDVVIDENTVFVPLLGKGSLKSYALKIEGDSMISPVANRQSFYPGQVILVDPEREPKNGDYIVALKDGSHEATFKQYTIDAGMHFLKALNPQYPNIPMDDTVKICGVVIARFDYLI